VMSRKNYRTSPNGATPHATLYAAMLREIRTKGRDSRFVKTDRVRCQFVVRLPVKLSEIQVSTFRKRRGD